MLIKMHATKPRYRAKPHLASIGTCEQKFLVIKYSPPLIRRHELQRNSSGVISGVEVYLWGCERILL